MADAVNNMLLSVEFDDGTVIPIAVKPRDIARLEELDPAFAKDQSVTPRRVHLLAWTALKRAERQGSLNGTPLPDSLEAFMDAADVNVQDDEGKASGPEPSIGSSQS